MTEIRFGGWRLMADRRRRYTAEDLLGIEEGDELRGAIFDGLSFHGLSLKECLFEECSFENADLRNVRLSSATFRDCNLANAKVAGAALFGATFERCKLLGVDFHEVERTEALVFRACNLDLADFRGLDLSGVRSEEHTSELQSPCNLVCRLLLEKKTI